MNGSLSDARLSTQVITAVAETDDVDPCDLPQSLHDVIDPDALDQLFRDRPDANGHVTFRFNEYTVKAKSDGTVALTPADP